MFEDLIKDKKNMVYAAILVICALLSFFVISEFATDPNNFDNTLDQMDKKSETVLALTTASTAAAAAITVIPGDTGTPIAEKLVDLSGYFLIVLTAIFFEKWMVTISGFIAFKFFIPICLLILAFLLFKPNQVIKVIAIKIIAFSLIIFAIIPVSVRLSDLIDQNYKATLEHTIEDAEKESKEMQNKVQGEEDKNVIKSIISGLKGGITGTLDKFKLMLSNFIEAIAVLLVTSIGIPIAVLAFAIWLLKIIAGVEINIPLLRLPNMSHSTDE